MRLIPMRKLHAMLTLAVGCLLAASCGRGGSGENEAGKFVVLGGKLPAGKNILCAIDQVNSKRVKSKPITVESGHPVHIHGRSEEHTSELQSLMRISYAVLCLKKKKKNSSRTNKQG